MSKARAKLFALADLVRGSGDDTAVVLEQRGGGEGVALVREARLNYLEDRVKQMDKAPDKPVTLAGRRAGAVGGGRAAGGGAAPKLPGGSREADGQGAGQAVHHCRQPVVRAGRRGADR